MIRLRPRAAKVHRHLSEEQIAASLSGVLLRGLRDALRNAPIKESARKRLAEMKLIQKLPNRYSGLTPRGLGVLQAASAIEARRAETAQTGSVADESAVAERDAQ